LEEEKIGKSSRIKVGMKGLPVHLSFFGGNKSIDNQIWSLLKYYFYFGGKFAKEIAKKLTLVPEMQKAIL
jgi:hypothetical protein